MPHVLILLPLILYVLVLTACWRSEPKMIHIGVVNLSPRLAPVLDGFKKGMAEHGYVEGENVTYLYDGPAENITALDDRVQALLDANVDLIVAISTPAAQAAFRLAQDTGTPVVFGPVTDPVVAGLAARVSHPGGVATGVRLGAESEAKRLEWLLQVNEQIQRIYIPYNPDDASALSSVTAVSEAAAKLGVTIILRQAGNDDEITAAITASQMTHTPSYYLKTAWWLRVLMISRQQPLLGSYPSPRLLMSK